MTKTVAEAAIENGKLGGRPPGTIGATRQKANAVKAYIMERVEEEQEPIITALINKAKKGDVNAAKELFDRAMGKSSSPAEDNMAGAALLSQLLQLEQNLKNIANGSGGDPAAGQKLLQE